MTTIIWETLLSDLDKKEDVMCGVMKKLPFSEQKWREKRKQGGGKKGWIDGR